MKKITFVLTILSLAFFSQAQSYKDIGGKILLQQYADAKKDIDKRITNEKFASKPDAFILKVAIYAQLALGNDGAEKDQLIAEAEAAYKKYKEMDPQLTLVSDPIYRQGPVNLYSAFYSQGFGDYQEKKWDEAAEEFQKAVELSDVLIQKEIIPSAIDTNALIMAGYTAQMAEKKDQAAKYYIRLADNKVAGKDNESFYSFLLPYYFEKGDLASFEKYRALGQELYPNTEYFKYDRVDFAIGLAGSFDEKLKALEDMLAKDPGNYKATLNLGRIIYDTLHADDGEMPANAAALEALMVSSLSKATELDPSDELPPLLLGTHFIDKAEKINDERGAHVKAMQARTKPGAKPSKEDLDTRDALDKKYEEAFEAARIPYEKVASIYEQRSNLAARDKQQYRNVVGYLGDIYNFKRARATQAKATADAAKYEAASKKWNELYDKLR